MEKQVGSGAERQREGKEEGVSGREPWDDPSEDGSLVRQSRGEGKEG